MPQSKPIHVLYMEDDEGLANLVKNRLVGDGYEVDIARDGEEGLLMYEAGSYDLIALDYEMPVYNGLEVIEKLLKMGDLPPTIMITGAGGEELAVEAMKLGVGDYVVKDIEGRYIELIPAKIERIFKQHKLVLDKKRVEEALQESEAQLSNILSSSAIGIAYVENRKTTWVNEAVTKMFGSEDEEDYIGKDTRMFYQSDEEYERVGKVIYEGLKAGKDAAVDTKFVRKDGSVFDGHIKINAPDPSKPMSGTIINIIDITKYKQAEEALRESHQQYQSLFEDSPISLWIEDFSEVKKCIDDLRNSGVKDFREYFENNRKAAEKCASLVKVVDINRATLELYRAESKDDFFKGLDVVFDEDSYNTFKEQLIAISECKTSFESEAVNESLTGNTIYIALKWTVAPGSEETYSKVFVSIVDITDRRWAEENINEINRLLFERTTELLKSKERWRTFFETSMDVVYLSSAEGKFLDINKSGEELFGYTGDELLEIDIINIYNDPNDRDKFQEIIEEKEFVKDYETIFKNKDGTPIDCLETAVVIKNDKGSIIGYQGIIRDISERKRMEERLLRAQKMEALGTLTGGIAHDFNNILTSILGYASLLKSKSQKGDPFHNGLDAIEKSSLRAADLTSQLLAYTRRGKLEVKPVNMNRIVKEVYDLISKTFDKSIKTKLKTESNLKTVEGDESQLNQVVMNIAVNAQNAMPEGGTFKIETYMEKVKEEIERKYFKLKFGNYVCIKFIDTGLGMDEETLKRIFEPYFTTRDDRGGSGLGMSVVFGIVKGHDGYIDIESNPGKGTEIIVYLPASLKKEESLDISIGEITGGNETVLIIDDEKEILNMLKGTLEDSDYKVYTSSSGRTGLRTFKEKEIDLIILDIKMPEMGGKEVLEKLFEIDSKAKVLLSSGYSEEDQHHGLLKMGAKGFIGKPFVVEKLLRKIKEVLGQ